MTRLVYVVVALAFLGHASGDVVAAFIGAHISPTRVNCAFAGDPICAGGQVLGDPLLAQAFQNNFSAVPGALVAADKSYVDPRIGTANSTSGSATAQLGVLRAQSGTTVSSQAPLATGTINLMRLSTFSTARFQDTITVMPVSPSLLGTPGIMTASIAVSGFLETSAVNTKASGLAGGFEPTIAYADWRLDIQVGNTFRGGLNFPVNGFFGAEGVNHLGLETIAGALGKDATVTFSAPIIFGTPTDINVGFSATTMVSVNAAVVQPLTSGFTFGSAESIYMNTAAWNGIGSVRTGATPVDFTVASASGIDYALPVPEPRMAALFAVSLLLVAWRARREICP